MKKLLNSLRFALIIATALPAIVLGETIYFLVGNPRDSDWVLLYDAYVLPLSKQEDIDHARYLLSLSRSVFFTEGDRPLVVAKVGPGKDGINRNYVDPTFPEWSWHVVEFRGFGDYTAEILDGSPTDVEWSPSWCLGVDPRQCLIGFWAYTVVRELGPVPLYVSIVPEGQSLEFNWSGVGTNYVYALEGKESLANRNWFAVPGASWPLNTNLWTLSLTNAPAQFYRLRAELSNP